jgi:hypothetical protein
MFSDDALCKVLNDMEYHIPTVDLDILLDERPDLVRRQSSLGYPLHEACTRGLPLAVIQKLVDRFPEAVTANANDEPSRSWCQTPLFFAASRVEPQMDTIAYLVQADYPSCLVGTLDRPPLLHWCMGNWNQPLLVWTALVDWVCQQYPEAADLPDFNGRYAIHHATSTSDSQRFRQLLQTTYCDKLVDAHGNHLLHLAVADSHRVPQNVTCILEECPTAVSMVNKKGELPVHVAIKKQDRNLLLEHYPFALVHMSRDGRTVWGNVRRELERCVRVYYPEVGEVIDGDEETIYTENDINNNDTATIAVRREDDDWEAPCVSWIFPTNPSFLGELDRLGNILNDNVLPPLRRILIESCQSWTQNSLPPEVLNEIFLFAVPHYEEALTHTKYHYDDSSS